MLLENNQNTTSLSRSGENDPNTRVEWQELLYCVTTRAATFIYLLSLIRKLSNDPKIKSFFKFILCELKQKVLHVRWNFHLTWWVIRWNVKDFLSFLFYYFFLLNFFISFLITWHLKIKFFNKFVQAWEYFLVITSTPVLWH